MKVGLVTVWYNELSQKNRFQSVPIAALCLYNIQRENLVFKNSLSMRKQRTFSLTYSRFHNILPFFQCTLH